MIKVKMSKIGHKLKSVLLIAMAGITGIMAIQSVASSSKAFATASQTLSTKESLNSPVLNNQFNDESWNPWEMVCWGIFLSNFCQIGVDDYESAFSTTANYGSKGNGYQTLMFSTGNDSTNSETIKNLLDYAVNARQKAGTKNIYIGKDENGKQSRIENGEPVKVSVANYDSSQYQQATIKDILPNDIKIKVGYYPYARDYVDSGTLNTFYIDNNGLLEIFDLLDSWDIQIMGALIGKMGNSAYGEQLLNSLDWAYTNSAPLLWDCFGNICFKNESGKIVVLIPACSNQHLTVNPKINLLTSLVMNGGTGMNSYTAEDLVNYAAMDNFDYQTTANAFTSWGQNDNKNNGEAGHNAVGMEINSSLNGKSVLFYDTDSISWMNRSNYTYGGLLGTLFRCDGNATTGSTYPLKLGTIGSGAITDKISKKHTDKTKGSFGAIALANASSTIADQCASISTKDQEVLSYYRDFSDTHKIELFSDEPVYAAVSIGPGYNENGDGTWGYFPRKFMNYIGQRYNGKLNENTVSEMTIDEFRNTIDTLDSTGSRFTTTNTDRSGKRFDRVLLTDGTNMQPVYKDFVWAYQNEYNITGRIDYLKTETITEGATLSQRIWGNINENAIDNFFEQCESIKDLNENYSVAGFRGGKKLQIKQKKKDSGWTTRAWGANYGKFPARVIKTWGMSDKMVAISNYLNITEGTDFSASASMIYLSYLDYYELVTDTDKFGDKSQSSAFNEKLFNWAPDAIPENVSDLVNAVSEEDMEKDILRLAYLSLAQTEEGRQYRNKMMIQGINDFVYEQYCRIVYGTSGVENGVTSKSNASFLRVHTLDENFLTSTVLEKYAEIAIWLLGLLVIFTVVVGILRGKKFSWYLVTTLMVINAILILPSIGDILPYASNRVIQTMFSDKMTFWSMSELINNYSTEKDFTDKSGSKAYTDSLTDEEIQAVMSVVDSLDSLQLDRSLMVKQDISNKMLNVGTQTSDKLQQYQSTRWILPLVMQQYGADSETPERIYDYVYVNLSDTITDAANIYWFNYPDGKTGVKTVAAMSDWGENYSYFRNNISTLKGYNGNFTSFETRMPSTIDDPANVNKESDNTSYRSYNYWKPHVSSTEGVYNLYYIANNNTTVGEISLKGIKDIATKLGDDWDGFQSDECIDAVVEMHNGQKSNFESMQKYIETTASKYNRNDGASMRGVYGYLDATESPITYFYTLVQSYFNYDTSYAYIVKALQGGFDKPYDDNGNQIEDAEADLRVSITNQLKTGYVVDALNLEDMFKYMIPYMYEMTIVSGGNTGTDGVLGEAKIGDDLEVYKDTNASWLFRSNWAIKIIENPDYCKDTEIGVSRSADGTVTKAKIKNAALPSEYERVGREMVFSEAQQKKLGLKDEDLSICELECIKINKEVARKWVYLLNYVGTDGINREILLRQMAIDANLIFNANISSPSIVNTKFEMFPSTLDLRTISFDSIMKMLCLNMTKDTSYLYGDTMKVLVEDSDIVTSILLLICAFLCCYGVGFLRDATIAVIFYSSVIHIIRDIASSNKQKLKVTMGTLVSTLVVTVATVIYYGIIHMMVAITSTEEVLNANTVVMKAGNPVWLFLIVIILSLAYMFGCAWFCWKAITYAPQEIAEIAASLSADARDKVSGQMNKVKESLGNVGLNMDKNSKDLNKAIRDKSDSDKESLDKIYKNVEKSYDKEKRKNDVNPMNDDSNKGLTQTEKDNISEINKEIEKGRGQSNVSSGQGQNSSGQGKNSENQSK